MKSSFSIYLLYHAYVYLEFLIWACTIYILAPKTSSGTRIIPMTEAVYECFKRIVENRKKLKKEPVIDGYKGFLFLDKKDMPEVALHWEKHFEWALAKHNRIYKEQLPKITPHVCRHTYCSNMAKSGMNPKTLQYLMGHSDIGVTLNTYTCLLYTSPSPRD